MSAAWRAAAVTWWVRPDCDWDRFAGRFREAVLSAEAELVVLPELFSLELLGAGRYEETEVPSALAFYWDAIVSAGREVARDAGATIVAGSHFHQSDAGVQNVCPIVHPDGTVVLQPKVNLTTYERQVWRIEPGRGLARLPDPRLGVTVCYDVEFPEAGRALAEDGALVHAVPAFTETRRGFQRVRWSCLARAVENQVFVAHASLRGSLNGEPLPTSAGTSALIAPSVAPFPESAILAEDPADGGRTGHARATLDFDRLAEARRDGDVRNWHDRRLGDWRRT